MRSRRAALAALTGAEVTYERLPGASHGDVARRALPALRAFVSDA